MNAYEKAQSLQLTGTDSEIVAVLKTLTASDIPVSKVAVWLRENLLWYWVSPTAMAGAFQNVVDNPATPTEVKAGLGLFFSSVFGDGAVDLQTTVPQWAKLVSDVMAGLLAIAPQHAALVDSFYALDGGRPYKDLDVPAYAAQKSAAELAAIVTEGLAAVRTKIDAADDAARAESRKAGATVQSIVAAADAAWGG